MPGLPLPTAPLHAALAPHLDEASASWLAGALERVAADPAALPVVFPGVGRRTGRGPLDPSATDTPHEAAQGWSASGSRDEVAPRGWTVDDAARVLLVVAAGPATDLRDLYVHGDAAERRAVLHALPYLAAPADAAFLVDDAVRTNDPRLVAAALGPYAAATLSDQAFEQAVLKCVFVGIPLPGVAGLPERTTPELARMLASYAHERVAAGRAVDPDVWPLVLRHPPEGELTAIRAEAAHPVADRSAAARRALADLDAATVPSPE